MAHNGCTLKLGFPSMAEIGGARTTTGGPVSLPLASAPEKALLALLASDLLKFHNDEIERYEEPFGIDPNCLTDKDHSIVRETLRYLDERSVLPTSKDYSPESSPYVAAAESHCLVITNPDGSTLTPSAEGAIPSPELVEVESEATFGDSYTTHEEVKRLIKGRHSCF